jgi:hypothetical protein
MRKAIQRVKERDAADGVMERFNDAFLLLPTNTPRAHLRFSSFLIACALLLLIREKAAGKLHQILTFSFPKYTTLLYVYSKYRCASQTCIITMKTRLEYH